MRKRGENLAIKQKRMQAKLTQRELAEMLCVDQSTVCLWETGKTNPRASLLPKLAKILSCSIDDLLSDNEDALAN